MSPRPPFLAIPRAALESDWYRAASPLARALWLELMSLANYGESVTRKGLVLKPGQLVTSWGDLRQRLGYAGRGGRREYPPLMNIRRTAAFLEKAGEATYTAAGKAAGAGTVVTLPRWALYAGQPTQAAETTAETQVEGYAGIPATQEERDLPPAGRQAGKTLNPEERRRLAREKNRADIEETRRILAEEERLREGVRDDTVH